MCVCVCVCVCGISGFYRRSNPSKTIDKNSDSNIKDFAQLFSAIYSYLGHLIREREMAIVELESKPLFAVSGGIFIHIYIYIYW